jgi:hypothetical protein
MIVIMYATQLIVPVILSASAMTTRHQALLCYTIALSTYCCYCCYCCRYDLVYIHCRKLYYYYYFLNPPLQLQLLLYA